MAGFPGSIRGRPAWGPQRCLFRRRICRSSRISGRPLRHARSISVGVPTIYKATKSTDSSLNLGEDQLEISNFEIDSIFMPSFFYQTRVWSVLMTSRVEAFNCAWWKGLLNNMEVAADVYKQKCWCWAQCWWLIGIQRFLYKSNFFGKCTWLSVQVSYTFGNTSSFGVNFAGMDIGRDRTSSWDLRVIQNGREIKIICKDTIVSRKI